jgi:hypothetical protein
MEADKVLGQRIVRAICYKHLQENLTSKYGVGLKALFWSLARAKIQHVFDKILGEIRAIKPTAAAYLEATVSTLLLLRYNLELISIELPTVDCSLLPRSPLRPSL